MTEASDSLHPRGGVGGGSQVQERRWQGFILERWGDDERKKDSFDHY